MQGRL